jgi:hypothetical protein
MGFTGLFLLLLGCFVCSLAGRKWQHSKIKMYYQPSNKVWRQLFEETDLQKIKFKPSLLALNEFS